MNTNQTSSNNQSQITIEEVNSVYNTFVKSFTDFFFKEGNLEKIVPNADDGGTGKTAAKVARNIFKPIEVGLQAAEIYNSDSRTRAITKSVVTNFTGGLAGTATATALTPLSGPGGIAAGIIVGAAITELAESAFDFLYPEGSSSFYADLIRDIRDIVSAVDRGVRARKELDSFFSEDRSFAEILKNTNNSLEKFWQERVVDNYEAVREGIADTYEFIANQVENGADYFLDISKQIKDTTFEVAQDVFNTVVDSLTNFIDRIGGPSRFGLPPSPDSPDNDNGPDSPDNPDNPNEPSPGPSWLPKIGFNPFFFPPISPLVIDIDNDGVELTSLSQSSTQFDLDGDGFAELTGWVEQDDALLAHDVNGNGRIDDISELFGNATTDGFTELRKLDDNNNGIIDIRDPAFDKLLLWRDLNKNGLSEVGEVTKLLASGLLSIDLNADEVDRTRKGHKITHVSSTTWIDGSTRAIEDVWFENNQMLSHLHLPENFQFSEEALSLPSLRGYGDVPDLSYSLTTRRDLVQSAKAVLNTLTRGDLFLFTREFEKFLWSWVGVEDVPSTQGGKYIDGRHLAFLEAFYGQSFYDLHTATPGRRSGQELEKQYQAAVDSMASRFLIQSVSDIPLLKGRGNFRAQSISSFRHLSINTDEDRITGSLAGVVSSIAVAIKKNNYGTAIAEGGLLLRLLRSDFESDEQSYLKEIESILQKSDVSRSLISTIQKVILTDSVIQGTNASESLLGEKNGDLFLASEGNDTLKGSYGSDTYLWGLGGGNDTIDEFGYSDKRDQDTLLLTNLNAEDITLSRSVEDGSTLVVTILKTGETLTIDGHFSGTRKSIEKIVFQDGQVWGKDDILSQPVWYQGGNEDDVITGLIGSLSETFDGGKGDDILKGRYGSDTYRWGSGSGNDTVDEFGHDADRDQDTLVLTNLNPRDVVFSRSIDDGETLVITSRKTGETLTIDDHFSGGKRGIEKVIFKNGQVWNRDRLLSLPALYKGTDANDVITGLIGSLSETFDGGKGDDILKGRYGSDTYRWGSGGGNDIVDEQGYDTDRDQDVLVLTNLNPRDVAFSRSIDDGETLVITSRETGKTLTIDEHFYGGRRGIEKVIFKNGQAWNRDKIEREAWYRGSSGVDFITGLRGRVNETFDGGKGDDILTSGSKYDTDTMVFVGTFGHDTITDFSTDVRYKDTIRLEGTSVSTFSEMLGHTEQIGKDTLITLNEQSSINLIGVDKNELQASNFDFL